MTEHTPISKVSRIEVISTGARRRWTLAEKQRIVAESYSAPRLVSATARRNGLSTSQLFTWRRLARAGLLIEADEAITFTPACLS
jgi:transposase